MKPLTEKRDCFVILCVALFINTACAQIAPQLDPTFNASQSVPGNPGTAEIILEGPFSALLNGQASAITLDTAENLVVGATVNDFAGDDHFAALKLTPTGNIIWSSILPLFESGAQQEAFGVAVDTSGCVYLGGMQERNVPTFTRQFAAAKLDQSGILLWTAALPFFLSGSRDIAHGIAVNGSGVYLGGHVDPVSSKNRFAAAKLTLTGTLIWTAIVPAFSNDSDDRAMGVALDPSGFIYLGGFTDPIGAVPAQFAAAKLNPSTGALIWTAIVPNIATVFPGDRARGIVVDPSGAVYLGGSSDDQFAAAKLNTSGTVIWTAIVPLFSGSSTDQGNAIALDSACDVYLAGTSDDTGGPTTRFAGVKLSSTGVLLDSLTAPRFSPNSTDQANGVVVSMSGTIHTIGTTEDNNTNREIGLINVSNSGLLLLQKAIPLFESIPTAPLEFNGIAVDQNDNLLLAGTMPDDNLEVGFGYVAVKLTSSGLVDWITTIPSFSTRSRDTANGVAVDASGAVYLAGETKPLELFVSQMSAAKLSTSGLLVWTAIVDSILVGSSDVADAIAVDSSGSVYLAGDTNPPGFSRFAEVKLSTTGQTVWTAVIPFGTAPGFDQAAGIVLDVSGCSYLGGTITEMFGFNPRMAAAKVSPSGQAVWTAVLAPFTTGSEERANGIARDSSGCLYLGGRTRAPGADDQFAAAKLTSTGQTVWTAAVPNFSTNSDDTAQGVALDPMRNIYLGGQTQGTTDNFAAAKLSSTGGLLWTIIVPTFFDSSSDQGRGIAIDSSGAILLAGGGENIGTELEFGGVAKLIEAQIFPPGPLSMLFQLPFVAMAAA